MGNIEEKVVEVLTEKIEQLEDENELLKQKVSVIDNVKNFSWLAHSYMSAEENKDLPLPRLEMRYEPEGNYGVAMIYGIVRKHYIDGLEFIPLSKTTTSRGADDIFKSLKSAILSGNYDAIDRELPYRDGVHIKYDSMTLSMPIFIRCEDLIYAFEISEQHKQFIRQTSENL